MIPRILTQNFTRLFALLIILGSPGEGIAGYWGEEDWGQMYWGKEKPTRPVLAPTLIKVSIQENELLVSLQSYEAGADGWSVITKFDADCGDGNLISSSSNNLSIPREREQAITCDFFAVNAVGVSRPTRIHFNQATLIEFSRIFYDQFHQDQYPE